MEIPVKEQKDDDNKGDDDQSQEQPVYSFGVRYYYWDFYKNHEWFIPKKYASLQEEIQNNLKKWQWDQLMTKANTMLKGEELRKLKSYEWKNYGVNMNEPIRCEHILTICLYTDYDSLSCEFSKSFRKISSDKSDEDTKKRNMEYREWSRILRETVECYGTTMEQTKIKVFYHGVSMIYFDSFIATFCCPTSTTAQLEV